MPDVLRPYDPGMNCPRCEHPTQTALEQRFEAGVLVGGVLSTVCVKCGAVTSRSELPEKRDDKVGP